VVQIGFDKRFSRKIQTVRFGLIWLMKVWIVSIALRWYCGVYDAGYWNGRQRVRIPDVGGMVYTVGNEQDYHFKVLFLILKN
jgi:hypothetical protein